MTNSPAPTSTTRPVSPGYTPHAEKSVYVQQMFGRIAHRYDLMNRLMTFGQDARWRRFLVRQARLEPGAWMLDIATGTGDIAFEAQRQVDDLRVVAADFALPMMRVGQHRERVGQRADKSASHERNGARGGARDGARPLAWQAADTLHLPYSGAVFDAVVSGYLLRNVTDIPGALAEQLRVLKPGGRLVTLDTTPPPHNLLRPFIQFHLKYVIPTLGRVISGQADAYRYLPESTLGFKTADELADLMRAAGLVRVGYRRFMFGTMAVHWGEKPPGAAE